MVIQDEKSMELQKERQLLIVKIDQEQDTGRRGTLISHLTILESRIEKRLQDLNVKAKPTAQQVTEKGRELIAKLPEEIKQKMSDNESAIKSDEFDPENFIEAKKLRNRPVRDPGLVVLKEKHEVAQELINLLDKKGYNIDQKRKILSNAYQKLYRGQK